MPGVGEENAAAFALAFKLRFLDASGGIPDRYWTMLTGSIVFVALGNNEVANHWSAIGQVPAETPLAAEVAKALKGKGFKYCGPVITYAFMQAVGMVNDHLVSCDWHG